MDTPFDILPRYQPVRLLGSGGSGTVHEAVDTKTGQRVAVKIFHKNHRDPDALLRRFSREATIIAQLDHPSIVEYVEHVIDAESQQMALVMEFIEGPSLRQLIQDGTVTFSHALEIATQLCEVLSHIHDRGFVHLDLKPENILLQADGRIRLTDFGASQGTRLALADGLKTMATQGTIQYMPPEQLSGSQPVDQRADLFALGVILHELITGERPFGGELKVAGTVPLPIEAGLERLLTRLLHRDPDERYALARDVGQRLRSLEDDLLATPPPMDPPSDPLDEGLRAFALGQDTSPPRPDRLQEAQNEVRRSFDPPRGGRERPTARHRAAASLPRAPVRKERDLMGDLVAFWRSDRFYDLLLLVLLAVVWQTAHIELSLHQVEEELLQIYPDRSSWEVYEDSLARAGGGGSLESWLKLKPDESGWKRINSSSRW